MDHNNENNDHVYDHHQRHEKEEHHHHQSEQQKEHDDDTNVDVPFMKTSIHIHYHHDRSTSILTSMNYKNHSTKSSMKCND